MAKKFLTLLTGLMLFFILGATGYETGVFALSCLGIFALLAGIILAACIRAEPRRQSRNFTQFPKTDYRNRPTNPDGEDVLRL